MRDNGRSGVGRSTGQGAVGKVRLLKAWAAVRICAIVPQIGCARNYYSLMAASPRLPAARLPACEASARPRALAESFTHRLHTLQKLTDRVTQAAYEEEIGLPLGEARCLSAVGAFSPLSVKDVAHLANVDKGQASRAVQALVDKGLVLKNPDPQDARGVVLSFTPEGERLWHRLMAVVEARNQQIVACLTTNEQAQLDRLLNRLVTHARAVAEGRA